MVDNHQRIAQAGSLSPTPIYAAMWVLGNDFGFPLYGWTAEQIVQDVYTGPPAIALGTDSLGVGVGHGHSVFSDGHIIVTSEDEPPNANESYYYVQPHLLLTSGELTEPPLLRMRCGDMGATASTGARWATQLGTGEIVLGREYMALLNSPAKMVGVSSWRNPIITTNPVPVLSTDVVIDASQRLWLCDGNRFHGTTRAALLAGGVQAPDKIAQGANISTGGSQAGLGTMAFNQYGGLWATDYNSSSVKLWDEIAIAALNGVANNMPTTAILTCPLFSDIWAMNLDVNGGMWVADYLEADNKAYYFTAQQLSDVAVSGTTVEVMPARILHGLPPYPVSIRFSSGYGLFLR